MKKSTVLRNYIIRTRLIVFGKYIYVCVMNNINVSQSIMDCVKSYIIKNIDLFIEDEQYYKPSNKYCT